MAKCQAGRKNMNQYTRKQKEVFIIDVLGYGLDDAEEMPLGTLNEIVEANKREFSLYTDWGRE